MIKPVTLHRCPGLLAWISEAQCATNAQRGRAAKRAGPGTSAWAAGMLVREVCPQCPGVVALAAGTRVWPERGSLTRRLRPKAFRKLSTRVPIKHRERALHDAKG